VAVGVQIRSQQGDRRRVRIAERAAAGEFGRKGGPADKMASVGDIIIKADGRTVNTSSGYLTS
jgi:hypothetical protein